MERATTAVVAYMSPVATVISWFHECWAWLFMFTKCSSSLTRVEHPKWLRTEWRTWPTTEVDVIGLTSGVIYFQTKRL